MIIHLVIVALSSLATAIMCSPCLPLTCGPGLLALGLSARLSMLVDRTRHVASRYAGFGGAGTRRRHLAKGG